ncbi:hypothetical protein ACOSP7_005917 [Xanthoceras sorbifolium]
MASSPLNTKSLFHARSNSLPSRPHPLVAQIDEHLRKLEASRAASTSLSNNIIGLADIYDLVNNFLLLPHTLQALTQECREKQVDEVLDRSLKLVNVCGITKDALLQIKEEAQELQSVLRRRRGDESTVVKEVAEYLCLRKKANMQIRESLKDLKSTCSLSSTKNETTGIICMLREVEAATLRVFESLLPYISGTKPQSRPSSWSLVSKLMHSKRVSCEARQATQQVNEFEKADATLYSLIGHKSRKSSNMNADNSQNALGKLDLCIQDLEEGLERLLRRSIKTRVSLLNILNH